MPNRSRRSANGQSSSIRNGSSAWATNCSHTGADDSPRADRVAELRRIERDMAGSGSAQPASDLDRIFGEVPGDGGELEGAQDRGWRFALEQELERAPDKLGRF